MFKHPKLIFGLIVVVIGLGCCAMSAPVIKFALDGKMLVSASEIAAERCLHQEGIDAVIVGQYVFECERENHD